MFVSAQFCAEADGLKTSPGVEQAFRPAVSCWTMPALAAEVVFNYFPVENYNRSQKGLFMLGHFQYPHAQQITHSSMDLTPQRLKPISPTSLPQA
ncbi:MAG TPA: hypothetical protein VI488_01580 [Candidatus Angelobacter sp.]